jgi:hypothetical protein
MPEKQKISVISFDHWNYDKEIVRALNQKNVVATHINFGKYRYANIFERIGNAFYKVFLNKNPKHFKRQDQIIEKLKNLGKQDQILVLNPDLIDLEYHFEIKKYTNRYIAYLYDSVTRSKMPIEHLLNGIFDEIYSFDTKDVQKYHFIKTNNYIYSEKQEIKINQDIKNQVFNISSFDKRFGTINDIAKKLNEINVSFKFILVNKTIFFKIMNYKIRSFINSKNYPKINSNIQFLSKKISLKALNKEYLTTNIILDLVQGNQTGLSFRVFEALALQKKMITDNSSIKKYSFYNPNNILVIDTNNLNLDISFFNVPYEPIPNEIYHEFTIGSWVDKVFKLSKS